MPGDFQYFQEKLKIQGDQVIPDFQGLADPIHWSIRRVVTSL